MKSDIYRKFFLYVVFTVGFLATMWNWNETLSEWRIKKMKLGMSTNLEIVELLIQLSEVSIYESVTLLGNLNLFAGVFDNFAVLLFDLKKNSIKR